MSKCDCGRPKAMNKTTCRWCVAADVRAQESVTPAWRPAIATDRGTNVPMRWKAADGLWRYPSGIQADNLLQFDTARCEVRAV